MLALKVNESDKIFVRKLYGATDESIKRDVEILKDWLKKQPHLPQGIQDDTFFEGVLMRNKCRVEKAKQKIDNYYTLRGLRKDLYDGIENLVPSKLTTATVPMSVLTENRERIVVIKLLNTNAEFYDLLQAEKTALAVMDLMEKYDYNAGVISIFDCEGYSFGHLKKVDIMQYSKFVQLFEGYSNRFAGIELVNVGSVMTAIMNFCKIVLPKKLLEKIRIHENLESLQKAVPKEVLPKDLGGNLPPLIEINQKMDGVYKEHREFFIENKKLVSNEKLRVGKSNYKEDLFGSEGTFKKLNFD